MPHILYLHGFNSAGNGGTSELLRKAFPGVTVHAPTYAAQRPREAFEQLTELVAAIQANRESFVVVGTSLGGFWARLLSRRCNARAVLINPAVEPSIQLARYLGPNTNFSNAEQYELTEQALQEYGELEAVPQIGPKPLRLAMIFLGDEVIDVHSTYVRLLDEGETVLCVPGGQHRVSEKEVPVIAKAVQEMFQPYGTLLMR